MSEAPSPESTPAPRGEDVEGWDEEMAELLARVGPITRRLCGVARGDADEEDYERYLLEKYG